MALEERPRRAASKPAAESEGPRRKPGDGSGRHQIALALQGGGSHGAFTWGVLDRLLEERDIDIVAISGTSAGAMNAAVLADGLRRGASGGREELRQFWEALGRVPGLASLRPPMLQGSNEWHFENSPFFLWFDLLTRVLSPYKLNPFNIHPLRPLIEHIDFEGLRGDPDATRVFIGATNVRTGRRRVFDNAELSADVLLASACLPFLFQAVEINGEGYWDGGYTGNPAIAPLYQHTSATDLVIIGINPLLRETLPRTAREIASRVDEISFNSSFMLELSAIAFIDQLLDADAIDPSRFKPLLLHSIHAGTELAALGASSKLNSEPAFLAHLHGIGRRIADRWIAEHFDRIGKTSTVELSALNSMTVDYHTGLVTAPQ